MNPVHKDLMLKELSSRLPEGTKDIVDEFIQCYLLSDEAAQALLDHITFQTGLTPEQAIGEEEP